MNLDYPNKNISKQCSLKYNIFAIIRKCFVGVTVGLNVGYPFIKSVIPVMTIKIELFFLPS